MAQKVLWDKVGTCASAVCAVHCLLTGVALAFLSSVGFGSFGNIWVDVGFLGVAVLVGGIAMVHGVRHHGSYVPALFYVGGLASIVVAHFEDFTHLAGREVHVHGPLTTVLSVVGGMCFVTFHLINMRLRHILDHREGKCACGAIIEPGREIGELGGSHRVHRPR